jgi:hypothetical protein
VVIETSTKTAELRIKEAKGGNVQLSQSRFFLMSQKFKIKKGYNVGKAIYVIKMSELKGNSSEGEETTFEEIKSFLLSEQQFNAWLALLIQLSERPLEGEKVEPQKKL